MKYLPLVFLLAGCGTIDSIKNSHNTDFVLVSQSQAGGIVKLVKGQVTTCKLSKHGVTGLDYVLSFDNGKCVVEAQK